MKKLIIFFTTISVFFTACHSTIPPDETHQTTAVTTVALTTPPVEDSAPPTPENTEVIGVWISYIELSGILTRKSKAQFRESYALMLDNCANLGINTVYVHLRPFGDALYDSDYYPWSKYITGTVGRVPEFDPLAVMLEETKKRDIAFHGWLNPMRIQQERDIERVSEDFSIGKWYRDESKRGKYLVRNKDTWFLNPAYPEVIELIANGVREITEKYDVDGIHIDDYFYPTTSPTFDSDAFEASSFPLLTNFRRFNINTMVSAMYDSAKSKTPGTVFSISPQGSISKNLDELYADILTWTANKGFADYIIPQLYYGFNHPNQPFAETASRWQELVDGSDMKLMFGLAVYKINREDEWAGDAKREWIEEREILRRQIEKARESANYGGVIFFSYNWLFNPTHVTDAITDEINAIKPLLQQETT